MAQRVTDALSNTPEHIEEAVKAIGRSKLKRGVFEAIYYHKMKVKSVNDNCERTDFSRKQVLDSGKFLKNAGIINQTKKSGDTAYEQIEFFNIISTKF